METQRCGAARRPLWERGAGFIAKIFAGTPFRPADAMKALGKIKKTPAKTMRSAAKSSAAAARSVWTNKPILQKVMGRIVAVGPSFRRFDRLRRRPGLGGADRALALFNEPAGDHGVGVFIEPLIEEGSDFLAEIGGVAKAGEFVGSEGVAGSGEKELPRRLGAMVGHCGLQYDSSNVLSTYSTPRNPIVTSNSRVYGMWKSVENAENPENPMGACSGCAGDYEDPDRSAWRGEFEEEEGEEVADERGSEE